MTREELKSTIDRMVTESIIDTYIAEMNYKDDDMKDFQFAIDGIKKISFIYINVIKEAVAVLEELTKRIESVKNNNDLNKLLIDAKSVYPKRVRAAYKKLESLDTQGKVLWPMLQRSADKFNIKWSDESIEIKEKIKKELDEFTKDIVDTVDGWMEIRTSVKSSVNYDKVDRLTEATRSIDEKFDSDVARSIIFTTQDIYNVLVDETQMSINDIYSVKMYLKLENKNKLFFKIINKLVKTKPRN